MNDNELILRLYEEERNHARYHESQRAALANMITVIAAGLIGFITFDQKISGTDLFPAVMIVLAGLYGMVFMAKIAERTRLHFDRGYEFLKYVNNAIPGKTPREIMLEADARSSKNHTIMRRINYFGIWITYHFFITIIGALLAVLSLSS